MKSFPSLKLAYFDFTGRAEAIRKTLTMGSVPFVDHRISFAEFKELKPTLPFGKVPVLEVDAEIHAETQGLLRYAACLAGLYPPATEPEAALLVDEMLSTFEDFFDRLLGPSFDEKDPAIVKTMREAALAGPLPEALALIDARLAQIQAHPFFVEHKKNVYLHEVLVWDYVVFFRSGQLEHIPTTFADKFRTVILTHDKVVTNPVVQQTHEAIASTEIPRPVGNLKLSYFDVVGRGEHIRLALHIGGIAFEDERLSREAFAEQKHLFPNAQVPALWSDGRILAAQSFALLRYVGRITGLYPTNDLRTAMKIDEVLGHINELDTVLFLCMTEKDLEKQKSTFSAILKTTIPESLGRLNDRVKMWKTKKESAVVCGGGGDKLTIADLAIYNLLLDLKTTIIEERDLAPFDQLNSIYEAVAAHPRVIDWYKTTTKA